MEVIRHDVCRQLFEADIDDVDIRRGYMCPRCGMPVNGHVVVTDKKAITAFRKEKSLLKRVADAIKPKERSEAGKEENET